MFNQIESLGKSSLTIRDKLRTQHAKRWHTVAMFIDQSVAGHSHSGGIIAEELLVLLFKTAKLDLSIEDRYVALKYFQAHDFPELITGDQPSPYKRFLEEHIDGYKEIVEEIECKLVPEFKVFKEIFKEKPYLKYVCKLADIIEGVSFSAISKGLDEQHNAVILAKSNKAITNTIALAQENSPSFDWSLTLNLMDEILHGDSIVIDFEKVLSK